MSISKILLDVHDKCNNALLHYAALHGHLSIFKMLINFGCDASVRGWMGWTPLHFACKGGHSNVVKMLLSECLCHSMLVDDNGNSPIHIAATFGHWNIIQILVTDIHCDVNAAGEYGWTALHYACQGGHISTVKKLNELNCSLMESDKHGNTPIHIAAFYGEAAVVRLLVEEFGCNVDAKNEQGMMPLHAASEGGHSEIVRILILHFNCSPMSKDGCGYTPLHYAAGNGHQDVIRLLVNQFCCNVDVREDNGLTPLHTACAQNQAATVRLLIKEFGCNPLTKDYLGNTPLHIACRRKAVNVVHMLIPEFGVDNNAVNKAALTSLNIAAEVGSNAVIQELAGHIDIKGHPSVLQCALKNERWDTVSMLIEEYDFDPSGNWYSSTGTPLHLACKKKDLYMVRKLIKEYCVKTMAVDGNLDTPLEVAIDTGNMRIVMEFLGHVDIDKDNHYWLLHRAYTSGHSDIFRVLISNFCCNPNTVTDDNNTILRDACEKKDWGMVCLLIIEFGCDPNVNFRDDQCSTPLHLACKNKDLEMVHRLISDFDVDTTAWDENEDTPLEIAIDAGDIRIVRELVGRVGFLYNRHQYRLLQRAYTSGQLDIFRMLVSKLNLNPNSADDVGERVLFTACKKKDLDMVRLLIAECCCNPNVDYGEEYSTPLHLACKNKDLELVHQLISDFDVNTLARDENEDTPLEIAIDTGDVRIVKELVGHVGVLDNTDQCYLLQKAYLSGQLGIFRVLVLEFNCDPSAVDDDGESVLFTACEKNDLDMVCLLITEFGYNPNVNYDDWECSTPLHLACKNKDLDMVHKLISDFDVDTMALDENEDTPLEIAIDTFDIRIVKEFVGHVDLLDNSCQCRLLQRAYTSGQLDIFRVLVSELNFNPNAVDDDGESVLFTACKKKDFDMVRPLITEFGCNPNVDYGECSTPLHLACKNKDLELVHTLISDFDVDTMALDENEDTPLEITIDTGDIRIVEEFVGHVGVLNNVYQCYLLQRAYTSGQLDIFRVLVLEFNCDPSATDDDGESVLFTACEKKDFDMVKLLVTEFGCNPNVDYDEECSTPLHLACKNKDLELVHQILSDFDVDTTAWDENEDTPLEITIDTGDIRIVEEFIGHVGVLDNIYQYYLLQRACTCGQLDIFRVLVLGFNCDPSAVDDDGESVLFTACEKKDFDMVHMLISEYDVNINAKDKDGDTAIDVATASGCINIVKELAKHTDISRSQLQEGLCCASSNGHLEIVEFLIVEFDVDPSSKNSDGDMPIHIAARHGHTKIVSMLINQFNISPVATGHNMRTPLHEACASGSYDVFKLLVTKRDLDVQCKDVDSNAPLHIAAKNGQLQMVMELTQLYGALAHSVNAKLQTPLHLALTNAHKQIADILLSELNTQIIDVAGNSPLHLAAMCGYTDMVSKLIQQYKSAPDCLNSKHQTPLHIAFEKKHGKTANKLLSKFHCCPTSTDSDGNTPLHLAAVYDLPVMVRKLIDWYGSIPDCENNKQETPLLLAAEAKNWTIVNILVSEMDCCPIKANLDGNTPLHYAVMFGQTEIIQKMIKKCTSTPDCSNNKQETALLLAVKAKNWAIVDILVSEIGCSPVKANLDGNTPLHYAVMFGQTEIVQKMIKKCASTPDCSNKKQETPLLLAAKAKNWEIVDVLVSEVGGCPMKADVDGNTPLHYAAMYGPTEINRKIVKLCKSTLDCTNNREETPLLLATKRKKWPIVRMFLDLSEFSYCTGKADVEGDTPLHYTIKYGPAGINRKMIKQCKSTLNCVNSRQETPLLLAAKEKKWEIVDILLSEGCSPTAVDAEGNTILHVAAKNGNSDLVTSLLSEYRVYSEPRNNSGHTPLYYASTNRHSRIVAELVKHNCNPATVDEDYKILEQISHSKLSEGSLTKIFVIGNKSAGKSTLIEALKNETQQDPHFNDKVISHTAGIVPSVHQSEQYGHVLFYDFAGDPEYYSSHAAALERLLTSSYHIFLLVVDFSEQEEAILQTLGYWLTFISYNSKDSQPKSQVIVVGSHADIIEAKGEDAEWKLCELFTEISSELCSHHPYTEMVGYCSLDCHTCERARIEKLYKLLKQCCPSPVLDESKQLSVGAIILLGVLQRDFKGVIACEVAQICMHIQLAELYLPQGLVSVYSYLQELNSQGVVLIVGNHEGLREEWVILDVSEFLATVHRKLFSSTSLSQVCSSRLLSNVGIIPESDLRNVLAQFDIGLLQQCLKYLQYCFEVDDSEVLQSIFAESVYTHTGTNVATDSCNTSVNNCEAVKTCAAESALLHDSSDTTNYNSKLLFFPALLRGQRSEIRWYEESPACCKGWYIECAGEYDYFPPRFLHVLLLRLAFTFSLPAHNAKKKRKNLDLYSRRCNMWKSGIYWFMQTDVECMVEVVKQNKGLVVIVRSKKEFEADCAGMFSNIVLKVLEARQDFCHSLAANAYLIHPDDLNKTFLPRVEDLHLFDMGEVKRALANNENSVVSVGEQNFKKLPLSRLQTHSIWSKCKYKCLN